ncbi:VanZ family protein [Ruminococcus sp. HUN007]|uniref:VanZ family protein n=1 Tax=Ruminococcus sp. HUN007 TaxID=1514668 RepID=UPI0006785C16|nr:VanZ family protein [Ruminococcus sp. HUN007]
MFRKIYDKRKEITNLIFLLYILAVLSLTFIVRETMVFRTPGSRGVVMEPFRELQAMIEQPNHFFWFMQITLNVLLFIPFGFLLPCVSRYFRSSIATVASGFCFSCFIEMMQYITGRGLTEADDIITNTAGAAAGVFIYWTAVVLKERSLMKL